MPPITIHDIAAVYIGVGVSFIFSVVFLFIFIKSAKPGSPINYPVLLIIAAGILASTSLVGDAPFVSLIQGAVVSLGTLAALYIHVTKSDSPNPRIVATLAIAMITSLVINQASRHHHIGLIKWFGFEVRTGFDEMLDQVSTLEGQVASIKADSSKSRYYLNKKIEEIEENNKIIETDIAKLISYRSSLDDIIKKIQEDDKDLGDKIAAFSKSQESLVKQIENIQANADQIKIDLSDSKEYQSSLFNQINALKTNEESIKDDLKSVKETQSNFRFNIETKLDPKKGGDTEVFIKDEDQLSIYKEFLLPLGTRKVMNKGQHELYHTKEVSHKFLSNETKTEYILRLINRDTGEVDLEMPTEIGSIDDVILVDDAGNNRKIIITVLENSYEGFKVRWTEKPY